MSGDRLCYFCGIEVPSPAPHYIYENNLSYRFCTECYETKWWEALLEDGWIVGEIPPTSRKVVPLVKTRSGLICPYYIFVQVDSKGNYYCVEGGKLFSEDSDGKIIGYFELPFDYDWKFVDEELK